MTLQERKKRVNDFVEEFYNCETEREKVLLVKNSPLKIVLALDNDNISGWIHEFSEEEEGKDGDLSNICSFYFDSYGREMFLDALGIDWEYV